MSNLLVGAIIGFLSAFLLRSWQYRRDVWLKRIEGLCTVLDLAAEVSTKYWLQDHSGESAANEARILGLQSRMDGMFSALDLDKEPASKIVDVLTDFRDSLTGGNFAGASRQVDPDRARLTQMYASDLIVEVWSSAYEQLSFSHWWQRRLRETAICFQWTTNKLATWRNKK